MTEQNPYSPPTSDVEIHTGLKWRGKLLMVKTPAVLPKACVNCGSEEELLQNEEKLSYVNPLHILWIFIFILIVLIAMIVARKRLKLSVFRCQVCHSKLMFWRRINLFAWSFFLMNVALLFFIPDSFKSVFAVLIAVGVVIGCIASPMASKYKLRIRSFRKPFFLLSGIKKTVKEKFDAIS